MAIDYAGTMMSNTQTRRGANGWERFDPRTLAWVPLYGAPATGQPSNAPGPIQSPVYTDPVPLPPSQPLGFTYTDPVRLPSNSPSWPTLPPFHPAPPSGPRNGPIRTLPIRPDPRLPANPPPFYTNGGSGGTPGLGFTYTDPVRLPGRSAYPRQPVVTPPEQDSQTTGIGGHALGFADGGIVRGGAVGRNTGGGGGGETGPAPGRITVDPTTGRLMLDGQVLDARDPRLWGTAGWLNGHTGEITTSGAQNSPNAAYYNLATSYNDESGNTSSNWTLRPEVLARLNGRVQLNQSGVGGFDEVIDPTKVTYDPEFGFLTTRDNISARDPGPARRAQLVRSAILAFAGGAAGGYIPGSEGGLAGAMGGGGAGAGGAGALTESLAPQVTEVMTGAGPATSRWAQLAQWARNNPWTAARYAGSALQTAGNVMGGRNTVIVNQTPTGGGGVGKVYTTTTRGGSTTLPYETTPPPSSTRTPSGVSLVTDTTPRGGTTIDLQNPGRPPAVTTRTAPPPADTTDYNSAAYAAEYNALPASTRAYMHAPGSAGLDYANEQDRLSREQFSGTTLGFADGGPIQGPGGPRDDNLVIRASDGEFVIPADVVEFKGKEFFDKLINKTREATGGPQEGGLPPPQPAPQGLGFADGGLVTDPNEELYLQPSGSAGLETLPALGDPPPMEALSPAPSLSLGQPVPMSETEPIAPAAAMATAPAPTSGLGLASYKAARSQDDMEYLKSLPIAEKIGLVLQSAGNAMQGLPNPIEAKLEMKRRREVEFRNELRTNLATITTGMEAVRKLPPGKGRDALIEQIVRASNGDPAVAEALKAVGTESEAQVRSMLSTIKNPRVQKMLTDASLGAADPRAEVMRLMGDKDFMDRAEKAADLDAMPGLTGKLRVISQAMEKMGLKTYTFAELAEQNGKLPKEYQLDDGEMAAAKRNQDGLQLFGLKSEKMLAEERAAKTKREEGEARSAERKDEREFAIRLQGEQTRQTAAEIARVRADAARQAAADKAEQVKAKDFDKKVSDLGKRLETAKLNDTSAVIANVEAIIEKDEKVLDFVVGPKSLYPDVMMSKEITSARQAVSKLFNIELKNRSGAAVTVPEFERLKDEYGKGAFKKPEQLREAIKQARELINNHYRGVAAGFEPEVLAKYNENLAAIGGTPVIDVTKAPEKQAGKGGATPSGIPAGSKRIGKTPDGKPVWQDASGKKWVEG